MKKRLIALAVASVFVSPVALADNENIKIYGKLHISMDSLDDGQTATVNNMRFATNSSRLGFKGTEDLGGGLKVEWQLENQIDGTGAAGGSLFMSSQRDTYIGLAGNFGTVRVGRLPAANDWLSDAELFSDQVGAANQFMSMGGSTADGGINDRLNMEIKYISPKMSGFSVIVSHQPDSAGAISSTGTEADRESSTGVRVAYADGPIKAGLTHWRFGNGTSASSPSTTALGGTYDLGEWLVAGQMVRFNDEFITNATTNVVGQGRTNWSLGARVKVGGSGAVKVQFAKAGSVTNVDGSSANQIALGYDHSMSKRTMLYANYARVSNGANAGYAPYTKGKDTPGAFDPANGLDPSAFSFGIVHDF